MHNDEWYLLMFDNAEDRDFLWHTWSQDATRSILLTPQNPQVAFEMEAGALQLESFNDTEGLDISYNLIYFGSYFLNLIRI